MNKITSVLSVVFILCTLSACAARRVVDHQLVAQPDTVSLRLASAVDKASTALQTLASIEQARNPSVQIDSVSGAPQELRRILSVDWNGPIEPITKKIADRAGYKFRLNGDRPPVPIIISLKAHEKSVIESLRDIGLQAGRRATIEVDAETKIVEINYAPTSGNQ